MKNISRKLSLFCMNIALLAAAYIFIEYVNFEKVVEFRRSYNSVFIQPITFSLFYLSITSFILLFFSDTVFNNWVRKIAIWYVPLAGLVIAIGVGSSLIAPSRTDLAMLLGQCLVAITLVFALLQKFYFKK